MRRWWNFRRSAGWWTLRTPFCLVEAYHHRKGWMVGIAKAKAKLGDVWLIAVAFDIWSAEMSIIVHPDGKAPYCGGRQWQLEI